MIEARPESVRLFRGAIRRAGWTLADQAVNTATNFVLVVVVARSSSAEEFGVFAVAYALYAFTIAISQAVIGETIMVTTDPGSAAWRATSAAATGAAVALGGAIGCLLLVYSTTASSTSQDLVLLLAVALPLLLVQDTTRVIHIAAGHPVKAAINDAAWALLQAAGFVILALAGSESTQMLFLAWALAGMACALLGCVQLSTRPALRAGVGWIRTHKRLGGSYAIESLALAGSTHLTTLVVAGLGSFAAAGALRAGQAIFGPASVPMLMLRMVGITEARAAMIRGRRQLHGMIRYLEIAGTLVGTLTLVAVLLLPDGVGRWLFGETWVLASALLLPLGLQKVIIGYSVGSFAGLRVLRAARLTLAVRTFSALATFLGGMIGAIAGSAEGCAYGLLIGSLLGVAAMQVALARRMKLAPEDHVGN